MTKVDASAPAGRKGRRRLITTIPKESEIDEGMDTPDTAAYQAPEIDETETSKSPEAPKAGGLGNLGLAQAYADKHASETVDQEAEPEVVKAVASNIPKVKGEDRIEVEAPVATVAAAEDDLEDEPEVSTAPANAEAVPVAQDDPAPVKSEAKDPIASLNLAAQVAAKASKIDALEDDLEDDLENDMAAAPAPIKPAPKVPTPPMDDLEGDIKETAQEKSPAPVAEPVAETPVAALEEVETPDAPEVEMSKALKKELARAMKANNKPSALARLAKFTFAPLTFTAGLTKRVLGSAPGLAVAVLASRPAKFAGKAGGVAATAVAAAYFMGASASINPEGNGASASINFDLMQPRFEHALQTGEDMMELATDSVTGYKDTVMTAFESDPVSPTQLTEADLEKALGKVLTDLGINTEDLAKAVAANLAAGNSPSN
ncbi:hypothetical protein [Sulfitobacter sp. R18_1]|uniref:hypothetical protein n=1 Tax=Sulfitobacter sp. R18_1 TaxID=2821104 RepID=UPI001ADCCC2D|nr:hypothetical protein [Sulfitobacter sp. R18_1]MBO9428428.1 hypothetical protein [Sulfitobacter sp. R18_1]